MTILSSKIEIVIGDLRLQVKDTRTLVDHLRQVRHPNLFQGLANSYRVSRDGQPGTGWFLLTRAQLNSIDQTLSAFKAVFTAGPSVVTIEKLHIVSAIAVVGTTANNPTDVYLVEFQDNMAYARMGSINKGYNVTTPDWYGGTYFLNSTDEGDPWTWEDMLQDIWVSVPAIAGGLNVSDAVFPSTSPTNFQFYGGNSVDALCEILKAIDHSLVCKKDGSFAVIPSNLSEEDNQALRTAAVRNNQYLIPSDPISTDSTTVPEKVRVFFTKHDPAFQESDDPLVTNAADHHHTTSAFHIDVDTDVAVPEITGSITGAILSTWSDTPALFNELGVLQDEAGLTAIALERAIQTIGNIRGITDRNDVLSRPLNFELSSELTAIHWYDFGDGIRTQTFSASPKKECGSKKFPEVSHQLPYERFAVGTVYNAEIAANGSGLIRILSGTRTSSSVTTWAETGLPHEVRAFEIYGATYAISQRVYIAFHRQTSRWVIICSAGSTLVRFELLEDLDLEGYARAKLLKVATGGAWEDILVPGEVTEEDPEPDPVPVEIIVHDPYRTPGMWCGKSGYQGFAFSRGTLMEGDSVEDPDLPEYDVVWMTRLAPWIRFTSTERMSETNPDEMAVTVDAYDHQGEDPEEGLGEEETIKVYQHGSNYDDVPATAKGQALYDYTEGKYYIIEAEHLSIHGSATLTADTCGDSTAAISSFSTISHGDFCIPSDAPSTASNPKGHAGIAGDVVDLIRVDAQGNDWKIVGVAKHAIDVVLANRYDSLNLQSRTHTIYTEICAMPDTEDWVTWTTAAPCVTP